MFDLFLALLLVRAVVVALVRRFAPCAVGAVAALALWAALAFSGWFGRGGDDTTRVGPYLFIFLGPSSFATFSPIGGKVALAALLLASFGLAVHAAKAFSPLSDRASELRKLGLVFLLPAVLVVNQVIVLMMVEREMQALACAPSAR